MSATTDAQIASIQSSVASYQSQLVALLGTMATFRPSEFDPIPQVAPVLTTPAPFGVETITPLGPLTSIEGTNPDLNPYIPLTTAALPQFTQPTVDTTTSAAFLAQFETLIPTLFTAVETEISQLLTSGGQNVGATIQSAVFNSGYERNLQTLNDTFDLAGARAGAKGQRYVNSMVKALQAQAMTTYQYGLDDMSRKIVETMANFAQANLRDAINAGIEDNRTRVQIFTQTAAILVRLQELALDQFKTQLSLNFDLFQEALKLQMVDLEVQKADREEMRAWIGQLRDQIKLASQVTIAEFEVGSKISVLQAEIQKYTAELQLKENEQAVQLFGENIKQFLGIMQIDLAQITEDNRLQVALLENTASTFAELMKSMSAQGVIISTSSS